MAPKIVEITPEADNALNGRKTLIAAAAALLIVCPASYLVVQDIEAEREAEETKRELAAPELVMEQTGYGTQEVTEVDRHGHTIYAVFDTADGSTCELTYSRYTDPNRYDFIIADSIQVGVCE